MVGYVHLIDVWVVSIYQLVKLNARIDEDKRYNKSRYHTTNSCINLRFTFDIKGWHILSKRVQVTEHILEMPTRSYLIAGITDVL